MEAGVAGERLLRDAAFGPQLPEREGKAFAKATWWRHGGHDHRPRHVLSTAHIVADDIVHMTERGTGDPEGLRLSLRRSRSSRSIQEGRGTMRLDVVTPRRAEITLSRRNLLTLIAYLDDIGSEERATLAFLDADNTLLVVNAEEDKAHYQGRTTPPGRMHPDIEARIRQKQA
jgi:hypothetical protein